MMPNTPMTYAEAAALLDHYNTWRRGDNEVGMPNAKRLGVAIDVAIGALRAPVECTPERVRCMIRNAQRKISPRRRHANWSVAQEMFVMGSTRAYEICRWAGVDPDGRD